MGSPSFTLAGSLTIPSDLERAFTALKAKQLPYARLWDYYEGRHPLVYATKKLQRVFSDLNARWCENWAAVVVDSLTDRIQLQGLRYVGPDVPEGQTHPIQQALDDWWDAQDVSGDSEEATQAVAVCGEGFCIVERTEDEAPRTVANPPHLCAVIYREDDPQVPAFAAKWWDDEGRARLTLYYEDGRKHYIADAPRAKVRKAEAFAPDPERPEEPSEDGIPLFHFRKDRRSRSRVAKVVSLNDALNKLFADMMVAAEFAAFKQRYIISKGEVTGAAKAMRAGASEVVAIPGNEEGEGQDTQVGEWEAADLAGFLSALDHIASRIAILTHTPKHYLLEQGDVSGEALIAMEAPLVKEAEAYRRRLSVTWRKLGVHVLKLLGHDVRPNQIEPVWAESATVQPYTDALIMGELSKAGLPLPTVLRMRGYSDAEVQKLLDEMAEDDARRAGATTEAMLEAQRRLERGENPEPYPNG